VIKTAKAAESAGYRATIVGLGKGGGVERLEVEGTQVVLVPTPLPKLQQDKLWPADKTKRQLWLMVEGALTAMAPVIEDLSPDLLHSHDMSGLRIGSALSRSLAAKGKVVPWVHDIHEYVIGLTTVPETYRQSSMEYERRYLRQADHLITVSDKLAQEVKRHYNLRYAPTVVYNAPARVDIDLSTPDVRSAIGLAPSDQLVVYIGVAKKERGCETIVAAVASLPNIHICFVSDSPYVKSLGDLAVQLGISDRFHSVPYVPSDQVVSYIRSADVGTHGLIHYPNGEVAMPNKMFEYLQAGIPMAVSDVAEMKRFVEHHGIGCVFEAENVQSCAEALQEVLNRRSEYAGNISSVLKEEYSWQSQAAKLKSIYENLLTRNDDLRELIVADSSTAVDEVRELTRNFNAELALVGNLAPEIECDFYFDHTRAGDRAGLLSRLSSKYDVFHIHGNPPWPSALERVALQQAGKKVVWMDVDQTLTKELNILSNLEIMHSEIDDAMRSIILDRGKAETKLDGVAPPDQSVLVELKAANKKIARLSATVKDQRRQIVALGGTPSERQRVFSPKAFLAAIKRKLLGPTLR